MPLNPQRAWQALKGRPVNNPVQAVGTARGIKCRPAFRAGCCLRQVVNPCAARRAIRNVCIPELRSATLHLHGVIIVTPLWGFEN